MMAALFVIFSLAIYFVYSRKRDLAIGFIVAGILLSLLMFWHHATDVLQINL